MVDQTIHATRSPETSSEAIANYAGSALLIGFAIVAFGIGVGFIRGSFKGVKNVRQCPEDVISRAQEELKRGAQNVQERADEIMSKHLDRVAKASPKASATTLEPRSLDAATLYYVKASFKGKFEVGEYIPETFIVEKPSGMTMSQFNKMQNPKFKSSRLVVVENGPNLFLIEEILNSAPKKQV